MPNKLIFLSILLAASVFATVAASQQAVPPIKDNSFLIEEAYNQEPGVVQHILLFTRERSTQDWELGFGQEWPLASQDHQLSYSIPLVRAGTNQGLGDVAINYRFRWLTRARSESVLRLTALLPTGDAARGLGAGGAGVGVNFPLSMEISRSIAAHWNAGGSIVPSARADDGTRTAIRETFIGASVVWLAHPLVNALAELVWAREESPEPGGTRSSETTLTLVPGVRGAINLRSGAQIVPGAGLMIDASHGRLSGLLLYLSYEHSF